MKPLWIIVGILLLIALGAGAYFLTRPHAPQTTGPSGSSFPQSGAGGATDKTYQVVDAKGNSVGVKDFINNGETIPDTQNKGNYLLAGKLGYCLPDAPCTAASTTDFNIFYDSDEKAFTIALLAEPLSQVRDEAETFLESRLGVTHDQLCAMRIYVGTTYWVNETYATGNLGFKNCPGATRLP